MRIGILTQPLHSNYGGLLQNYALQQVLLRGGHEVETIDHAAPNATSIRTCLYHKKVNILHALMPGRYAKPRYVPSAEEMSVIRKYTEHFIDAYIHRTQPVHSCGEFAEMAKRNGYDAFVVGSDQCWRPIYNPFLEDMFLRFVANREDVKRIAYAASFGTDVWEMSPEMTARCSALAKRFDLITTREDSGVVLCKKYLDVDATHVLDPTMLLNKDDYEQLVEREHEPQSKGTLFEYILDPTPEKSAFIEKVSSLNQLVPFRVMPQYQNEIRTREHVKRHIDACVYPPVTAWLRAFMDAEMTIVDSFHGMVFSIIFNRPFWVIGNKKRGLSRFTSLLRQFNLDSRLIGLDELSQIDVQSPIDWESVNKKKNDLQSFSTNLLLQALK